MSVQTLSRCSTLFLSLSSSLSSSLSLSLSLPSNNEEDVFLPSAALLCPSFCVCFGQSPASTVINCVILLFLCFYLRLCL